FFFFFQAEDGIRDKLVTGVQTCALPIYGGGATHVYSPFGLEEQRLWPQMDELLGYPTEHQPYRIGVALSEAQLALARRWAEIGRSEERRGGKGGRARWVAGA